MAKKIKYFISSYLGDNILEINIQVSKKQYEYNLKQCQNQAASYNADCDECMNVDVTAESIGHNGYTEYINKFNWGTSAFYFRKLVADEGLKFKWKENVQCVGNVRMNLNLDSWKSKIGITAIVETVNVFIPGNTKLLEENWTERKVKYMDNSMTVEKRVQEKLKKAIPQMSNSQKSYLLGYGEAVLDMRGENEEDSAATDSEND